MELLKHQKEIEIYRFIDKITNDIAEEGANFFDVVIEEFVGGRIYKHHGKAFSTNGNNFFGFAYDDDNKAKQDLAQHGVIVANSVFAGSYVHGKGLSIYFLQNNEAYLNSGVNDFSLNATHRPGRRKLHGKFWSFSSRVDIKPESGEITAETHLDPFIDLMAVLVHVYTDKTYALAAKGLSQEENVALIEKLYPKLQDAPILSVFADDGETPKTKS